MERGKYCLSVIVPVYNAESTIKRCLDSILNQSWQDFELILVDDGSTDRSGTLCDEYAERDNRVKSIHIKNSGSFQARKQGAERASGEVLTFSDADDWLDRNAFETVMDIFTTQNPDMLAYTYSCDNGKMEKHLYREGYYCGMEIREEILPGMMYDSSLGGRRLNPSLCCKLIKKELYIKVTESVNDRITLGEDALVTYTAVCLAESIFILNRGLYHYSSNPVSCTHTYPLERILEIKSFQDNLYRLFDEMGMLTQMRWQAENYVRSFFAMMIKNWYGMELSPVSFSFPYNAIDRNARIVIYGAGNVGKSYVNELNITGYAEIVGWTDKNYTNMTAYNGVGIKAPEQIKDEVYDICLIAVWDKETAENIAENLRALGIPEEKILWRRPVRII